MKSNTTPSHHCMKTMHLQQYFRITDNTVLLSKALLSMGTKWHKNIRFFGPPNLFRRPTQRDCFPNRAASCSKNRTVPQVTAAFIATFQDFMLFRFDYTSPPAVNFVPPERRLRDKHRY